jgi:uncharacterized protein (UPF0335 family)
MKIDPARIKSWVERIEALLEERAGINGDIRDIYLEIKKGDHDAKAIRKLIQRRAQGEAELAEQDALLSAYTDAMAGKIKALEAIAAGASVREAAKAAGISTGAAGALASVQKSRSVDAHHDPETGEINDADVRDRRSADAVSCGAGSEASGGHDPGAGDGGREECPHPADAAERADAAAPEPQGTPRAPVAPVDTRTFDEIVGERPAHLRRAQVNAA